VAGVKAASYYPPSPIGGNGGVVFFQCFRNWRNNKENLSLTNLALISLTTNGVILNRADFSDVRFVEDLS
jgi:hypothetical protein